MSSFPRGSVRSPSPRSPWSTVGSPGGGPRRAVAIAVVLATLACGDSTVAPPPEVASVTSTPDVLNLLPGDTLRLSAVARSAAGDVLSDRVVVWSSDRVDVATVDLGGLVLALAQGEATVTATIEERSASAAVDVAESPAVTPVLSSLEPSQIQAGWGAFTLVAHGSDFLPQSRVLWNGVPLETFFVSTEELEATVSSSYLTTEGTVQVTVETPLPSPRTSEPRTFTIVSRPALSVELRIAGNAVFTGDRLLLAAAARDQFGEVIEGKTITWTSSDSMIARVEGGFLRGIAPGVVQLTAFANPASSGLSIGVVDAPAAELLFQASPAGETEIFRRGLDPVGAPRRARPPYTTARQPVASPDGSRIAFVERDASGNDDIWVMDVDGTDPLRLTVTPGIDDQPAWSPDGLRIAFRSFRDGKSDVWVMDADGGDQTNLTFADVFFPEELNDRPSWSPDASTIVFSRGFGLGQSLWRVPAAGGPLEPFVSWTGLDLLEPAWSPDGALIAFRRYDRAEGRSTLEFVSSIDGSPRYLIQAPPADAWTPAWVVDGWLAMSAPAIPASTVRTVVLMRVTTGRTFVPLGAEYGELGEPSTVPR